MMTTPNPSVLFRGLGTEGHLEEVRKRGLSSSSSWRRSPSACPTGSSGYG
jgi:hypothetical protein